MGFGDEHFGVFLSFWSKWGLLDFLKLGCLEMKICFWRFAGDDFVLFWLVIRIDVKLQVMVVVGEK